MIGLVADLTVFHFRFGEKWEVGGRLKDVSSSSESGSRN
jgi:hypothetical protein